MRNQDIRRKTAAMLAQAVVAVLLLLAGCRSVPPALDRSEMKAADLSVIKLVAGDEVEVKFYQNPELNEIQVIRPDGQITLQLVGDVQAQGKTPSQLGSELKQRYAGQLKAPEVAVIVRSLHDRRVYVGGAVNREGMVKMAGPLSAMEAIMQSGGLDWRRAKTKQVVVIREQDGKRVGCALDVRDLLAGQYSDPFYLEPGDIVYVPRKAIVNVNQWIEQYINSVIPRFGVSYGGDGVEVSR